MASEYDIFRKLSDSLFKVIREDENSKKLIKNIEKEIKIGIPICMSLVMNNCEDYIKFCVAKGANPNMQVSNGFAALHVAAILGKKNAVNILFEMGADINLATNIGLTSLNLVRKFNRIEMIDCLLTRGGKTFLQLKYEESLIQELSQKVPISNESSDMMFVEGSIDGSLLSTMSLSGSEDTSNTT